MFGHTHSQYFEVIRSTTNPAKNIGLNQIGPSVTSYTENNPGYAIIEIDEQTMLPTNFLIYSLDLEKANASGVASWDLVVDYVGDYQMTEMSPDGLYDLAARFKTDLNLLSLFTWGTGRNYGPYPTDLDEDDGLKSFCKFTSTTPYEEDDCLGREHTSPKQILSDPVGYLFDYLIGDWKVKASKSYSN